MLGKEKPMKTITIGVATIAVTVILSTAALAQNGNNNKVRSQGGRTPEVSQLTKTGSGTLTLSSLENEIPQQPNNTSELTSAAATTSNVMESFNFGFGAKALAKGQTGQNQSLYGDFNGDGRVDASDFRSMNNANSLQNQNRRSVIMANTEGDFHFAGPMDHSQIESGSGLTGTNQRSLSLNASNGSSGNSVSQSPRPKRNVNVQTSNNLTATTFGRGSAKSRGK